ncbi:uncharacterized protein I303_108273 [Kwoniella dejecticola CBS 10117]|uniref:Trafficking protein particle complex II-specific subunit 65 IgD3 domain-containing protein n=1 Tax=Kwoniella dejecticola CBS 10117 TaxID=1296121 RepID=A0A1A5ZXW8_9TREE|nr:uncharacterized protein I303_07400 [Kwoniella dejecticola CBS 10117]OBR82638.1 hypothetical protein I303_07400 [Kwoniella dejecticola CBS 10117]
MPSPNLTSSAQAQAQYETLFHSSSLNLIIPEISSLPTEPNESTSESLTSWWNNLESSPTRDVAFFDEKLFYFLAMHIPNEAVQALPGTPALEAKEPTSEMLRFLGRLQLTMTASFIPPLPMALPPKPTQATPIGVSGMPISSSSTLMVPTPHTPMGQSTGGSASDGSNPPVTPNPFPAMHAGEEQYANVEGVVVWEGAVEEASGPWEEGRPKVHVGPAASGSGRKVIKTNEGWEIIWRGEVPIAYVRTQIQNPLLALTASVTLRDQSHTKTHRRNAQSVDTASIRSGTTTIRTDGTEYEVYDEDDQDEYANLEDIDLLGGLAAGNDVMPSTRLAPSLRQDLAAPSSSNNNNSPLPLSAVTPITAPTIITPSSTSSGASRERGHPPSSVQPIISTTLRKSYRRVLSLAPGLRVRMRTLFLPQLLTGPTPEAEEEGERCITLCVEIENSPESSLDDGFEVSEVKVDVGGKGGKASTELIKNQNQNQNQRQSIDFPLRLGSIEQYNLLYKVDIASSNTASQGGDHHKEGIEEIVNKSLGRNDEIRPVSIVIIGRPFSTISPGRYKYQTKEFHSRWNCSLDLTSFYASSPTTLHNLPNSSALLSKNNNGNRNSKGVSMPTNAIAGDKRYSLAYLLSMEKDKDKDRVQNGGKRPLMPSQLINQHPANQTGYGNGNPNRVVSTSKSGLTKEENGLMVSIKLLPTTLTSWAGNAGDLQGGSNGIIKPYETFSLEVFVHNKSEEIRRFKLCIPPRPGSSSSASASSDQAEVQSRMRDILSRRKKRDNEVDWGVDDLVLKHALSSHLSTAPAIIPLENDIRCGPLLPYTSLSARIRFLALREGIHKIEALRIKGINDEIDFTISPVLDIVVGWTA